MTPVDCVAGGRAGIAPATEARAPSRRLRKVDSGQGVGHDLRCSNFGAFRTRFHMDNSITLSEYADAVNAVGRKRVEKLNAEFHAGKRLFGASHHDLPDTMIRGHYERGSSPQEAYEQIINAL